MRDPCIIAGPDGSFHMVWTTGWRGKDIGYAAEQEGVCPKGASGCAVPVHDASRVEADAALRDSCPCTLLT